MIFRVYWKINDGRNGFPNIEAEPYGVDHNARSYEGAVRAHAKADGVRVHFISPMMGGKGKIGGSNYREFLVQYSHPDQKEKAIYLEGEFAEKTVRVVRIR